MSDVDAIEDKIAKGEMTTAQVFTQMRQLIKPIMTPERAREIVREEIESTPWLASTVGGAEGFLRDLGGDSKGSIEWHEAMVVLMREQQDNG